jgi:enamine deaminase RidA (YjgF/YER057c/UK114 family)
VSSHYPAETIEIRGCTLVVLAVEAPDAHELFFHCRPPANLSAASEQAKAVYGAINEVLQAKGGSIAAIVSEMVFLRDLAANIEAVRRAREHVVAVSGLPVGTPAITEIEQPPLDQQACLEILGQAVLPGKSTISFASIKATPDCGCNECARAHALRMQFDDETRVLAGGLCGAGGNAYEQTRSMFELAEGLLYQAGLEFADVVRTWIHLREMDRDYGDLNRARREFFAARGIEPVPASTAIGGGPVSARHDLCLGFYALKRPGRVERRVMTSPTLNEAPEYGADFVRGMAVMESSKDVLYVSGTASVDEAGRTAHVGDFGAQADRMLVNLAALLAGQGATYSDVVCAITYVKFPEDALSLQVKLLEAGFTGFPNVLLEADVCRPDLLCETELVAVLPKSDRH